MNYFLKFITISILAASTGHTMPSPGVSSIFDTNASCEYINTPINEGSVVKFYQRQGDEKTYIGNTLCDFQTTCYQENLELSREGILTKGTDIKNCTDLAPKAAQKQDPTLKAMKSCLYIKNHNTNEFEIFFLNKNNLQIANSLCLKSNCKNKAFSVVDSKNNLKVKVNKKEYLCYSLYMSLRGADALEEIN